jgi:hypothetical protein
MNNTIRSNLMKKLSTRHEQRNTVVKATGARLAAEDRKELLRLQ